MAEVVVPFEPPVMDESGRSYAVRVCGRAGNGGLWDGWIEFDPMDGGPMLRTPRETQQPGRSNLVYWATGLSLSYLEGALRRARREEEDVLVPGPPPARPTYEAPARTAPRSAPPSGAAPPARPVLDPYEVFVQGEEVLRQELNALDEGHLVNIIRGYALASDPGDAGLAGLRRAGLAEMIIAAVRRQLG